MKTNEIYSMEYDCKEGNLLDLTIGSCRCTRDLSNLSSIQNLMILNPCNCMQRVTDSNHSASNCTSACPSEDSFSKFRPQADLTVAPTGSKDTMIMTRINQLMTSLVLCSRLLQRETQRGVLAQSRRLSWLLWHGRCRWHCL